MMNTKPLLLTATLLASAMAGLGQPILTESYTFPVNPTDGAIPDAISSVTFNQVIANSHIFDLREVQVSLELTGDPVGQGWAGDMFVSLNRDLGGQTAILLNQAGVTVSDPAGFGHDGWNVTFKDSAVNGDIHLAQPTAPNTVLTGEWQPDGRLNPTNTARPSMLSVFNTSSANATWRLNVADISPGNTMSLKSWTLTLIGVPEPEQYMAAAGAGLFAFALWQRRKLRKPMA